MALTNKQRRLIRKTQRKGRPLKEAERYPSGRVKPEKVLPNARVVALRQELAGSGKRDALAAAESPLSLAEFRGWITPEQAEAGRELARLQRRAGMDLPSLRTQDLDRAIRGYSASIGDARAMAKLRDCARFISGRPKVAGALIDFCVLESWPAWIFDQIDGKPIQGRNLPQRNNLVLGLNVLARLLDTKARLGHAEMQNRETVAA